MLCSQTTDTSIELYWHHGVLRSRPSSGPPPSVHIPIVEEFVEQLVGTEGSWEDRQRTFMREHRPQSLVQRLLEPAEIANAVVSSISEPCSPRMS